MTYSPLAGGWLSGKYRKDQKVSGPGSAARAQRSGVYDSADPANAAKLEAADAFGALADETGITLIQMAIAFATRHPAVTINVADNMWNIGTPALSAAFRRR
jgi:aryl-alcohol dehydrogenase-like predicted oxidoreductase